MSGTSRAILRLDEIDSAAIQMDLSPRQRILLREPHACIYGDYELGQVLPIVCLNHLVKAVILFASQEAETADPLAAWRTCVFATRQTISDWLAFARLRNAQRI